MCLRFIETKDIIIKKNCLQDLRRHARLISRTLDDSPAAADA